MCSCAKGYVMPKTLSELAPETWGPKFWKLLHVLASRVGYGGEMVDLDAANGLGFLIAHLHEILPCKTCQEHAKTYIMEHRFKPQGGGADLRAYVEQWLLDFHNAVRTRKGQPILVSTVAEYHALWRPQEILPCDDTDVKLYFEYAKTYHIVTYTNLSRWQLMFKRMRLLLNV
jgi:hypothetical protein